MYITLWSEPLGAAQGEVSRSWCVPGGRGGGGTQVQTGHTLPNGRAVLSDKSPNLGTPVRAKKEKELGGTVNFKLRAS